MDDGDGLGGCGRGCEAPLASQGKLRHLAARASQRTTRNRPGGTHAVAEPDASCDSGVVMSSSLARQSGTVRCCARHSLKEFQLDDRAVVDEFFPALDFSVVRDQAIHLRVVCRVVRALSS